MQHSMEGLSTVSVVLDLTEAAEAAEAALKLAERKREVVQCLDLVYRPRQKLKEV